MPHLLPGQAHALTLNFLGAPGSLKRLQLRHSVYYALLLVLSGVMGVTGVVLWGQVAAERDRIAFMSAEVQEMRGSLYRQIKEVFDHTLLGDPNAVSEFNAYTRDIEYHFGREIELADTPELHGAIGALHEAYREVRQYGETFLAGPVGDPLARVEGLNIELEQGAFHEFERHLKTFESLLARKRIEVDKRLGYLKYLLPAVFGLPLLVASFLFVYFRHSLQRVVVQPLEAVMQAMRQISLGKLTHRVPEVGAAELVQLAQGVNQMANELASSREALVRAEKQATLGALVPVVAHNIRNPLASIRATAQVLDDPGLPEDVREGLSGIIGAADRLDDWTYALLSYLNPLEPQRSEVDVRELLDTVAHIAAPRLAERSLKLVRVGWEYPLVMPLDVHLMEQALLGLLNNAIEASADAGDVVLRCVLSGAHATLSVRDYGTGMVSAPVPRGLAPIPSTKVHGSGLGIPFAAKVCDVHGGCIEFINHDRGTEVAMILPLEKDHAAD